MKPLVIILSLLMLIASVSADENGSAKKQGANWANVSDEAQIQLLIDELRSAMKDAVRRQAVSNHLMKSAATTAIASSPVKSMRIDGSKAYVSLDGQDITLEKIGNHWQVLTLESESVIEAPTSATFENFGMNEGFSAGETFAKRDISEDYNINTLSKGIATTYLDRKLFGSPEKTASYYAATYRKSAPHVSATYVQFVIDPAWNRVVYGSLNRWIKAFDNVNGPSAIAVDADARVFVGETGSSRVSVLQLDAAQENSDLSFSFAIDRIKNPADIALDDNNTPLDVSDDLLYVADPVENTIIKFAVGSSDAQKVTSYDGFSEPTSVLVGRWNGANNNLIYVIDKIGKRVQLFEDTGSNLQLLRELKGGYHQYFSGIRVDHFGNVYLVDNVNSNLYKYSATLELLDQLSGGAQFEGLVNADIPFGRITVEGEGTTWAGFDQLFTLERWTENSGAQRRVPGLGIRNATFHSDADISTITNRFMITDVADVTVHIIDEDDRLVRDLPAGWMVSGSKEINWDRRDNNGEQVKAGVYRYQLEATSSYGENNKTTLDTRFYLPLYYWQDSGSESDDQFRTSGTVTKWGEKASQTIVTDRDRITYRFSGLNSESDYQISLEAVVNDGNKRSQAIYAGKSELATIEVNGEEQQTAWLDIPREEYADGTLELSIARVEGESAAVSQLWLKENGIGLNPEQLNGDPQVAEGFALEQNYPNPFNPTTTIRFRIPEDARVKLEVFNLLGQKVRTLVDAQRSAGVTSVNWDGRNGSGAQVSSGIYFYRLEAGSLVQSRQMLLIK